MLSGWPHPALAPGRSSTALLLLSASAAWVWRATGCFTPVPASNLRSELRSAVPSLCAQSFHAARPLCKDRVVIAEWHLFPAPCKLPRHWQSIADALQKPGQRQLRPPMDPPLTSRVGSSMTPSGPGKHGGSCKTSRFRPNNPYHEKIMTHSSSFEQLFACSLYVLEVWYNRGVTTNQPPPS
ncbi:hypothetical protein VTK56DRAFT_2634 [Thermocarpiscus australiensis]